MNITEYMDRYNEYPRESYAAPVTTMATAEMVEEYNRLCLHYEDVDTPEATEAQVGELMEILISLRDYSDISPEDARSVRAAIQEVDAYRIDRSAFPTGICLEDY